MAIFGRKSDEKRGGWSKLHNEELHDLYFSQNITVMKSRRIKWAWHDRSEMCTTF
jgi:hypothetical protein